MRHLRFQNTLEGLDLFQKINECYTYWWNFELKMCIDLYSRWITPMTDEDSN